MQISSVNLTLKTLQELCNVLRVKFKIFTLIFSTCKIHLLTPLLLSPLGLAYTAWGYLHKPLLPPAFFPPAELTPAHPSDLSSAMICSRIHSLVSLMSQAPWSQAPGSLRPSRSTRTSFYMYLCDMIGPCPSLDVIRPSVSRGQ